MKLTRRGVFKQAAHGLKAGRSMTGDGAELPISALNQNLLKN
jgi:hypothetical protein